jgi:hypothetical protein
MSVLGLFFMFFGNHPRENEDTTDPWILQMRMMIMSGQQTPCLPELNHTSLLYFALMMEELAEIGDGLVKVLRREWTSALTAEPGNSDSDKDKWNKMSTRAAISSATDSMTFASKRLRKLLEHLDKETIVNLSTAEAQELLDGTSDLAVVNCGFALASGMPAREGYDEVQMSNLSKANPKTGMIDKTPDGKWIKGESYFEADLATVLHAQRTHFEKAADLSGMKRELTA